MINNICTRYPKTLFAAALFALILCSVCSADMWTVRDGGYSPSKIISGDKHGVTVSPADGGYSVVGALRQKYDWFVGDNALKSGDTVVLSFTLPNTDGIPANTVVTLGYYDLASDFVSGWSGVVHRFTASDFSALGGGRYSARFVYKGERGEEAQAEYVDFDFGGLRYEDVSGADGFFYLSGITVTKTSAAESSDKNSGAAGLREASASASGSGLSDSDTVPAERFFLPYTEGLVAVSADDGYGEWLDAAQDKANVFGGLSPQEYFYSKGIPITHSVCAYHTGSAGYFTWEQLKELSWEYGCEIANHSASHEVEPTTYEQAFNAIVGNKTDLESHTDNGFGTYTKTIGLKIYGFTQPGGWTTANGNINNKSLAENSLTASIIKKSHMYSRAYAAWPYAVRNTENRYFSQTINSSYLPDTKEECVKFLRGFAKIGMRINILFHKPYSTNNPKNAAVKLKALADAIEYLRDEEGILQPVNVYNLLMGEQGSVYKPMVKYDFTDFEDGANLSSYNHYGINVPYMFRGDGNGTVTAGTVDGEKCHVLTKSASGNPYAYFKQQLTPGRSYQVVLKMRTTAATTQSVGIRIQAEDSMNPSRTLLDLITSNVYKYRFPQLGSGEWTTVRYLFTVPAWSNGFTAVMVRVLRNSTLDIADIEINPI